MVGYGSFIGGAQMLKAIAPASLVMLTYPGIETVSSGTDEPPEDKKT